VAKRKAAGGTPAIVALTRDGIEHRVHTYDHDAGAASYGLEAADAMGLDPGRVFKTLLASVDASTGSGGSGRLVVGIVPVSGQLDLKALAVVVGGKKAVMADPEEAERVTGYVVGGISPLGQKRSLLTVVDETVLRHDTVFVSGGRRGLEVELSPTDLVGATRATVAAIGR
jgi:Cys-tRNA(Pro)/Cys-tRNA(Cys) deacylase